MEKLAVHKILSTVTLVIGVLLLVYMVRVESEPGAIPLLLVIGGIGWHVVARVRSRARHP